MPLDAFKKETAAPNKDLTEEKIRALFEIAIMEEMDEIFKESNLTEDNTTMIRAMVKNSIRTLIGHVRDGVISTPEFCGMQRAIFRAAIELVHNT